MVRANPVTGRVLVHHDTALNGEKVGRLVREAARQAMAFTRSLRPEPGAARARVQPHHHAAEKYDPRLGRTRQGQLAEISGGGGGGGGAMVIGDDERKLNRYIVAAAVSMGTAIVGFAYPQLFPLTVASAIYASMRIFKNGYNALVHERKLRLNVIEALYLFCAFSGGFFLAGSFGLFAYYLSEKLVLVTQDRSQQSLINIFGQQPRTVWQRVGDVEVVAPLESVRAGDTLVIQAGQVIPVDGVITDGICTVDQHMLTGESRPVEKGEGDLVLTSTLVTAGRIFVRVEKTGQETAAAQIGVMLNNTASYQASIVSKGEQVADKWVPPTIALALVVLPVDCHLFFNLLTSSTAICGPGPVSPSVRVLSSSVVPCFPSSALSWERRYMTGRIIDAPASSTGGRPTRFGCVHFWSLPG